MKLLSITTIIRLVLLSAVISLFFACTSASTVDKPASLQEFMPQGNSKSSNATEAYWAIPEQYKNIPISQIKSQIKITDYMVIKGAATNAGTEAMTRHFGKEGYKSVAPGGGAIPDETPKNKADREALESYANKLITLEGVVALIGDQKTSPVDIKEQIPGKYKIWFCADKNQKRKPCRYRALLLYEGPESKGNTLFTHDNAIRFWGIILGEEIIRLNIGMGQFNYKRYPRIRVLDLEIIK